MVNKWIYDKVNRLVRKYQIRDPDELIDCLNIHLKYIRATESLLGMYRVILRNRFIFLPNNAGSLRKTVLAHDIGHAQLHRKECIKGATFHESRVFSPTNRYEIEANIFAAHLLIPNEDVITMIKYAKSDKELADELKVDINLLNLKILEIAKMNLLDLDHHKLQRLDSGFLRNYKPAGSDSNDYRLDI